MALSFLYLAFIKILQLVRLSRRSRSSCSGTRLPCFADRSSDRLCDPLIVLCSPGWDDCSAAGVGEGSSCSPRPCSAGTGSWSGGNGPMPAAQVDRASPPARRRSSSDSPGRTSAGATVGSRVRWQEWAPSLPLRASGSFCAATASIPHGCEPVSYTHLRAHETVLDLVCRLLL